MPGDDPTRDHVLRDHIVVATVVSMIDVIVKIVIAITEIMVEGTEIAIIVNVLIESGNVNAVKQNETVLHEIANVGNVSVKNAREKERRNANVRRKESENVKRKNVN